MYRVKTAMVAAALLLAACSGRERVVAEPLDMVRAKLAMMPDEADALYLGIQGASVGYHLESGADALVWHFTKDGADYCRYTARLVAVGPSKTRVSTRAEYVTDAADAAVAGGAARPDYSYLCDVARIATDESVAAALESRPADTNAVFKRIGATVAANPTGMMRSVEAALAEAESEMETYEPYDPCAEDIGSRACRDADNLQADESLPSDAYGME